MTRADANATDRAEARSAASAVRLTGVTKSFGNVRACEDVDIEFRRGEIHGVLGENGAGKSTLMRVLIGLIEPDSGQVSIDGTPVTIRSPQSAADMGIAMVHQHFSLVDPLRVWENVMLGSRDRLDPGAARQLVGEIGDRYGLEVDPDARVSSLSAGLRQRVEIIKCLRRDPDIVIFDEPTSVLTPQESEQLFAVLRRAVVDEGKAVALVSHKLDEILAATDRVTILRLGRVAGEMVTAEADAQTLAQTMVGRPVSLRKEAGALGLVGISEGSTADGHESAPALVMRDVSVRHGDGTTGLDSFDLEAYPGEILGIAGVDGNGQADLGAVLASLLEVDDGSVEVMGAPVATGVAGAMGRAGVAVVPEDRHDAGCILDMTVAENLSLDSLSAGPALHGFDTAALRSRAEGLIEQYGITTTGPDAPFRSLSGGNQQRVVLARELSGEPKVLIAAQPTRGLDVGAIEFVSGRLRAAADSGIAVVLISSELEEILNLADRIAVLYRGSVIGSMSRADATIERLGLLMGGAVA